MREGEWPVSAILKEHGSVQVTDLMRPVDHKIILLLWSLWNVMNVS